MRVKKNTIMNFNQKNKRVTKSKIVTPSPSAPSLSGGFNNELTVFHTNVNKGLLYEKKIENILLYAKHGADVVFIYEPGLGDEEDFPHSLFPNHKATIVDREFLIVLIRDTSHLVVEEVKCWTPAAKVVGRQVTIAGVYNRRSNDDKYIFSHQERFENLSEFFGASLNGAHKKAVIGGDFNLDLTQTGQKKQARGVEFALLKRGFVIGKFPFSRRGGKNQADTRPDWLAHRNFPGGTVKTAHVASSDHDVVIFENSRSVELNKKTTSKIEVWKFGKQAEDVAMELSPRNKWIENYSSLKAADLLQILQNYLTKVNDVCKRTIEVKNFGVPWYDGVLAHEKIEIESCSDPVKRKILRKIHNKNLDIARRKFKRNNNKTKGHPWPKKITSPPKEYVVTEASSGKQITITEDGAMADEQHKFWKVSVEELCKDSKDVNDEPVIERFGKKYQKLKNELPKDDPLRKEWEFRKPTQLEVKQLIKSSKPKASSSFDEISHRLVKKVSWHIQPILTRLLGLMISTSEFPEALHEIKLVPVHKAGKPKNLCSSYRPIAIQPTIAKLLDMWLCREITRITDHLNVLPSNVHGYRKFHSCASALRQLLEAFDEARMKNQNLCVLGLDYSKAYDTVSLTLCPRIIEAFGAGKAAVKLLKNFMTGRPSKVMMGKKCSDPYKLLMGILQGAATSPKLFSIITVDIADIIKTMCDGSIFYADDSLVYWFYDKTEEAKKETVDKIKKVANEIEKWAKQVQLKLNYTKTELICHSTCNKPLCGDRCKITSIDLFGKNVVASKEFKFVGMHMTNKGGLDPHVREICKKMNQGNGTLKRLQSGCSMTHKRALFHGLIMSHVMTSASAYLPRLNKTQTKTINSKVQACLRTISGVPLLGPDNFDGTPYSAKNNMNHWSMPTVADLCEQYNDINAYKHYSPSRHEFLATTKVGMGKKQKAFVTKMPNFDKLKKGSYARAEFLAINRRPELVDLKKVSEITNLHKNSWKTKFGEYERRKKTKQKIINTIKNSAANGLNIDQCMEILVQEFGEEVIFKKHYPQPKIGFDFKNYDGNYTHESWFQE